MVESVYTGDLKSPALGLAGSSPAPGIERPLEGVFFSLFLIIFGLITLYVFYKKRENRGVF